MLKSLAYASLLSTTLAGTGAYALANGAPDFNSSNRPAQIQLSQATTPPAEPAKPDTAKGQEDASKAQTGAQENASGMFVKEQTKDQWRAPKLIGVAVYDSENHKIGAIKDMLMDHNGGAQTVVIGIGGFLGIGTKEVGVPFDKIEWKTEPRSVPVSNQPPTNPVSSPAGGGALGAGGGGAPAKPAMKQTDPAATEASQGYPDKAILKVSLAEVKSAPDFKYAPSPGEKEESAGKSTTN